MKVDKLIRFEFKLVLGIILIDLLFALLAFIFLIQTHTRYQDNIKVTGHNLAHLLEQHIADKARLIDDAVVRVERELNREMLTGSLDSSRLEQLLESEQKQLPEIDAIRITNAEGDVLLGKGIVPSVAMNYSDREYFKQHHKSTVSRLIITEPIIGKVSKIWVIGFTRSYHAADGKFAGIISAAVPLETFGKLLETVDLGLLDTVVLRYADMGLVARVPQITGPEGQPGNKKVSNEFIEIIKSKSSEATFHTSKTPDSVERTYSFRRVSGWPFTLAVGLIDEAYMAPWRTQAIGVGALLVVFLLVTSHFTRMAVLHLRERSEDMTRRRILIDQSRDGIVVIDHDGKVWEANQRFAEMLGYSSGEFLQLHVWDWDAQYTRDEILKMIDGSDSTGSHFESRHRRKDGTLYDVEISTNGAIYSGYKMVFCVCRDITERKLAEQTIRENEQRLRALINSTPDIICFKDGSGLWLEANHAVVELFSLTEIDYRGKTNAELANLTLPIYGQALSACKDSDEKAWLAGSIFRGEEVIPRPDGTLKIYDLLKSPIYEVDGTRKGLVVLGRDITDRRLAEQKYQTIFREMLDGFALHEIICDGDGKPVDYRFIAVNPAFERITGLKAENLVGRTALEVMPATEPIWIETYGRVALTGQPTHFENFSSSLQKHYEIAAFCPAPNQFACTVLDITERKLAEQELRHSYELMSYIIKHSASALAVHDKDFKYLFVSERYLEDYKVKDKDIIGRHHYNVFPDLPQKWRDVHLRALAGITSKAENDRYDKEDGSVEWTTWACRPWYEANGEVGGFVVYTEVVTDRIKAEEQRLLLQQQLHQAQKMEAIGTLAGGIAHDFNNILGAVLGYAEMARDVSPPGSDIAYNLDRVVEAGNRAARLVQQILAFSREASTERILLQPVLLVKETLKLLRPALPSTITIKQQFDPATKSILADPTQVHQIVMNLCTNSFHAMEQTGGVLEITLRDCELSHQDIPIQSSINPGAFVELSIGDTGPGIAAEIKDKIFEPYFTTKEVGKGTGMGLSIIHGITTNMGGFITCDSELGVGTTFHVFFPAIAHEVAPPVQPIEMVQPGTESILYIDDEEILAEMGKVMLEHLGYKVTVRTNSIEALATFQNQPDQFDAVITDQTMPGMTGIEMARRMLQIQPGIPIILCTGYSNLINKEQAKAMGVKGFIMKPMSKKEIANCLRTVLDA